MRTAKIEELSLRGCVAALSDGSDVIRASGIGSCGQARELGSGRRGYLELGARSGISPHSDWE